ncbi:MAG: hypothetical protein RL141_732 [Candidatus Parcubacteria bacterium]|jgi:mRNA-degrading endonuclease YafQ of YafQ-DinJ toxin-antitoxin module
MKIAFHTSFQKQVQTLSPETQRIFSEQLPWFIKNRHHPFFRNVAVGHAYPGCRSISITSGIRALYLFSNDTAIFLLIGTHAELYG